MRPAESCPGLRRAGSIAGSRGADPRASRQMSAPWTVSWTPRPRSWWTRPTCSTWWAGAAGCSSRTTRQQRWPRCLDLPLASEIASYQVLSRSAAVDQAFRAPLIAALRTVTDKPFPTVRLHRGLTVRDADGRDTPAAWRVQRGDRPVVDLDAGAGPGVRARALAWAVDRWRDRSRLEAVLLDPSRAERLSLEADLDH